MSKQASAPPGHRAGPAQSPYPHPAGLVAVSLVTSVWVLLYALYRGYYAVGGTMGMIGTFRSASEWRALNLAGAVILLAVAVLPVTMLPLWRRPGVRRVQPGWRSAAMANEAADGERHRDGHRAEQQLPHS